MGNTVWRSEYFCGKRISAYGLQNGYVDYGTLASAFDCILNNTIFSATGSFDEWEMVNGEDNFNHDDEIEELETKIEELNKKLEALNINEYEDEPIYEDRYEELTEQIKILEDDKYELENDSFWDHDYTVYQQYIISDNGAKILQEYTNEVVWYNSELDMYIWDIGHYGTSWSYVLTDIKVDLNPVDENPPVKKCDNCPLIENPTKEKCDKCSHNPKNFEPDEDANIEDYLPFS